MSCEHPHVKPLAEILGSNVFSDAVMKGRLPKNVYKALRKTIDEGAELDKAAADVIANTMMEWALEKGATHFTHWFQPMTGVTAEKHDSFVSSTQDGRMIVEFGGKELIKGEPDASSFPSGGLRSTFEARGYTAWDCTSPAYVKENGGSITLCIPTVFCSYTGEALDKKTPLLRSMEAINKQSLRILRLFGNARSKKVIPSAGPEQEYFLVDKKLFEQRLDLMTTGRTLFGAAPSKGQELEDHYFGSIKERVAAFMNELNIELWKLGVPAKTQHNEVAPGQFELAPVYAPANIATDHNQIIMEAMRRVANHHGLACLLHEKPFNGVNGSGKHNNWSLMTDDGINLFEPGNTPHENAQFLVFLCAVIRAVDKYAKLLRASVATSGNDHRLGANEAPPAIVSIFLGDQLTDIMKQLEKGGASSSKQSNGNLHIGVSTLPDFPKDMTDRNRTSPFAFTGNKFEFRMLGSSISTAGPNFTLNAIVADVLQEIANELEKGGDLNANTAKILSRIALEHNRIIFNGNNYSEEWEKEAARRGLPNIKNCVSSVETLQEKEMVAVLERQKVLSAAELHARYEILLEQYVKAMNIEARTMMRMANRRILPMIIEYSGNIAKAINETKAAGVTAETPINLLKNVCVLLDSLKSNIDKLRDALAKLHNSGDALAKARFCRDVIIPAMGELRSDVDQLELLVPKDAWPMPTYSKLLFLF